MILTPNGATLSPTIHLIDDDAAVRESLALLIGIVIGALYRIWPWQHEQQLYSPWEYASAVGQADILLALCSALAGVVLMLCLLNLEKWLKPPVVNSGPKSVQ